MWDETQICLACQDELDPEDMGEDGICWDCQQFGHENGRGDVDQVNLCPDCGEVISGKYGDECLSCAVFTTVDGDFVSSSDSLVSCSECGHPTDSEDGVCLLCLQSFYY